MLTNLWGAVSHGILATYYGAGTLLTSVLNIGNGVTTVFSALRGDVRGTVTGVVSLISTGADHASQSSQTVSHAITAANFGFWMLIDIGNGIRWVYVHIIAGSPREPAPNAHLLALPAPPLREEDLSTNNTEVDLGLTADLFTPSAPPIISGTEKAETVQATVQSLNQKSFTRS